jgi:hypothetical protein
MEGSCENGNEPSGSIKCWEGVAARLAASQEGLSSVIKYVSWDSSVSIVTDYELDEDVFISSPVQTFTSPTSGGRSVVIVRLRTTGTEFSLVFVQTFSGAILVIVAMSGRLLPRNLSDGSSALTTQFHPAPVFRNSLIRDNWAQGSFYNNHYMQFTQL